jgi:hypothetical protein
VRKRKENDSLWGVAKSEEGAAAARPVAPRRVRNWRRVVTSLMISFDDYEMKKCLAGRIER